jgi:hypothetical protein
VNRTVFFSNLSFPATWKYSLIGPHHDERYITAPVHHVDPLTTSSIHNRRSSAKSATMIATTSFALLALSSLPTALCAPTFLGPLDHDFVSTLVPVVAASAPAFSDMLAFTHRIGEGLYNRDVDPAEAWVNDPEFANLAMNASMPAT